MHSVGWEPFAAQSLILFKSTAFAYLCTASLLHHQNTIFMLTCSLGQISRDMGNKITV